MAVSKRAAPLNVLNSSSYRRERERAPQRAPRNEWQQCLFALVSSLRRCRTPEGRPQIADHTLRALEAIDNMSPLAEGLAHRVLQYVRSLKKNL